jgi:hypothetical protein
VQEEMPVSMEEQTIFLMKLMNICHHVPKQSWHMTVKEFIDHVNKKAKALQTSRTDISHG